MSTSLSRSSANALCSGRRRAQGCSRPGGSRRGRREFSTCVRGVIRSLYGDNSHAVSGVSIPFSQALDASQLPVSEPNSWPQLPSTVVSPLPRFNHKTETLGLAYTQTRVLDNSPTDLAASVNNEKKTLIGLEKDAYNVRLAKKAPDEVHKKRTSELSTPKDEKMTVSKGCITMLS